MTHNKGIMNGVDSVVIATGNDFRAVEACAHSYASKDGKYKVKKLTYFTFDPAFTLHLTQTHACALAARPQRTSLREQPGRRRVTARRRGVVGRSYVYSYTSGCSR